MADAARFVRGILGDEASQSEIRAFALSSSQALSLQLALNRDAVVFARSAAISFVHACNDLEKGWYSWPTIKLYYTVFYAAQAMLSLKGHCVFHYKMRPISISAVAGSSMERRKGPTHKIACEKFADVFDGDRLLSQEIDDTPPLDWLVRRREETNYVGPKFLEPDAPGHFSQVVEYGMRRLLAAYVNDAEDLYTFDPEHAMVAFPTRMLRTVRVLLEATGQPWLDESARGSLLGRCRDSKGPIPSMIKLID